MCYLLFACAKLHRACSHKLACALCVNAVGVVTELKDMGVINDSTHLAGASCGAIIVSCVNAGMDLHGLVDKLLEVRGTAGVGTGQGAFGPLARLQCNSQGVQWYCAACSEVRPVVAWCCLRSSQTTAELTALQGVCATSLSTS